MFGGLYNRKPAESAAQPDAEGFVGVAGADAWYSDERRRLEVPPQPACDGLVPYGDTRMVAYDDIIWAAIMDSDVAIERLGDVPAALPSAPIPPVGGRTRSLVVKVGASRSLKSVGIVFLAGRHRRWGLRYLYALDHARRLLAHLADECGFEVC